MKTCAGIVLYNPNLIRLKENIDSIQGQVDAVVLVDNGSVCSEEIDLFLQECNGKITLIRNEKNFGIANALNKILHYAESNGYDWFLTLDQDTISNNGLIECYLKHINENIGQLSCNILDRNIGRIDDVKNFQGNDTSQIDFCITSGCFNNTKALLKVGGYDERLFIDGVDLDISCNLRMNGFSILKVNFEGIVHELGEGKKHNFLGVRFSTANHIPWRNYYARRNIIYVAKKYYKGRKKYSMILRQIFYGFAIPIMQDKKIKRIKYNFKGIFDGLTKNIDKRIKID